MIWVHYNIKKVIYLLIINMHCSLVSRHTPTNKLVNVHSCLLRINFVYGITGQQLDASLHKHQTLIGKKWNFHPIIIFKIVLNSMLFGLFKTLAAPVSTRKVWIHTRFTYLGYFDYIPWPRSINWLGSWFDIWVYVKYINIVILCFSIMRDILWIKY